MPLMQLVPFCEIFKMGCYKSTTSTSYLPVSKRLLQFYGKTVPMATHCPLFASDFRKAEYLK
jgi:hypothetical protein